MIARLITWIIAIAAVLLVGWYGYRGLVQSRPDLPQAEAAVPETEAPEITANSGLPIEPSEWIGRIDYRGLDRNFDAIARRPEMAGLAVAIVEDGALRFVQTYGVTDKRSGEWVMPETVFRWASVSKGVAGALAAKLSSQGALNIDAPIANWQTSLRLPGGANSTVTLQQLLSHQTGLVKNSYDRKLEDGQSPGILRASLAGAPLKCTPGTCHSYQNIAFDASAEILAQTAGTLYSASTRDLFFEPLGMDSVGFGLGGLTQNRSWARPHWGDEVRTLQDTYFLLPAAAGISSNIVDMARWMQAQMGSDPEVLSAEMLAQAHAPIVKTPRVYGGKLSRSLLQPAYGLGWRSFTYAGRRLVGHSGAVEGYRATMVFDPEARTGVVAMWNNAWGKPFGIPFAVLDSYYGSSEHDWLDISDIPLPEPKPPVVDDLP